MSLSLVERIDQSGLPESLKTALKQNLAPAVRLVAAAREQPDLAGPESRGPVHGGPVHGGPVHGGPAHMGRSRLGGLPDLPPGCSWPDPALSFIAQIDLQEAAAHAPAGALPPQGLLAVFYDTVAQPWGAPDQAYRWRIIYTAEPQADPGDGGGLVPVPAPDGVPVFSPLPLALVPDVTLPTPEALEAAGAVGPDQETVWEFHDDVWPMDEAPCHQLLGHPYPIQGDPLREAAQHGGPGEWQLLLQIDSDQRAGMMWGDAGMLYFCIRSEDLAALRFDRVWCIMQCS